MVKRGIHGHKHRHVARTLLAVPATVMQEQANDLKVMTQCQLHTNLATFVDIPSLLVLTRNTSMVL